MNDFIGILNAGDQHTRRLHWDQSFFFLLTEKDIHFNYILEGGTRIMKVSVDVVSNEL